MTDTRDKFETLRENPFVQDEEDTDEGRTGAPDDSEFTAPTFAAKTRATDRVRYLNHLIDVHGQRPQDAPTFDHSLDHTQADWDHDSNDYFTWDAR